MITSSRASGVPVAPPVTGEQQVIAIAGEAGIGKSALLDELAAAAADRGLSVLRGRAAEHERTVPFALAIDALDAAVAAVPATRVANLGPELGALLPAAAARLPIALRGLHALLLLSCSGHRDRPNDGGRTW